MNKKIKYVFVAVFIIAAGLSFILLNMKPKEIRQLYTKTEK